MEFCPQCSSPLEKCCGKDFDAVRCPTCDFRMGTKIVIERWYRQEVIMVPDEVDAVFSGESVLTDMVSNKKKKKWSSGLQARGTPLYIPERT